MHVNTLFYLFKAKNGKIKGFHIELNVLSIIITRYVINRIRNYGITNCNSERRVCWCYCYRYLDKIILKNQLERSQRRVEDLVRLQLKPVNT